MRQAAAGGAIAALVALASYSVFIVIVAIYDGDGHGSVFWTSLVVISLIAAFALWLATRLFRARFATRNVKLSL